MARYTQDPIPMYPSDHDKLHVSIPSTIRRARFAFHLLTMVVSRNKKGLVVQRNRRLHLANARLALGHTV